MPGTEISAQVAERLEDLHRRHLAEDSGRVTQYYESGRGYYGPEEAGPERSRFAICLATVDGELYATGDHEWPFPLHSISKVFAYTCGMYDAAGQWAYSIGVPAKSGVSGGILAVLPGGPR